MKKIFWLILLFSLLVIACGKQHQGQLITKEEFGNKWPFSVEKGYIYKTKKSAMVFETENGTKYAVNGIARNMVDNPEYNKDNYKDITEIWLEEENEAGVRKSLIEVMDIGHNNKVGEN